MPAQRPIKGRGALSNRESRYRRLRRADEHAAGDGRDGPAAASDEELPPRHAATCVRIDPARTIISRNSSPDLPFNQSINPYRGCEHGCVYCYARPSHAWLDHSPGLDFETLLYAKPDAAALLDAALRRPGYVPELIALGTNTDPYQPIEREQRITRSLLEKLLEFRHPVSITTKGALLVRDVDLLAELARHGLVAVHVSLPTLDNALKRTLEPRAASPAARLRAIEALARAGVPVSVLIAPVIPAVTDHELEDVVAAAARAGARSAGYILLRLPLEVGDLFKEWLAAHCPLRAAHVMSLVRGMRGGRDNEPRFGHRMRGQGPVAQLIAARFHAAARRHGLAVRERLEPTVALFRVPPAGGQLPLL